MLRRRAKDLDMDAHEDRGLKDVVEAIRSVEANLKRRRFEASALNVMIWGVTGAGVFLLYQFVEWNEALYRDLFGAFLPWMWAPPIALGYVLSSMVSLQAGRRSQDRRHLRDLRFDLAGGVLIFGVVAALVATAHYEYVPGAVLIFAGWEFVRRRDPTRPRTPEQVGMAIAGIAMGIALLFYLPHWTWLAAAAYFGVGMTGFGYALRLRCG